MGAIGHDGVAVCSRYELLKLALDGLLDETHLGLVRYGTDHLAERFNALDFITTKRPQYAPDREVRAIVVSYDPLAGGNRHIGLDNSVHPKPLAVNLRHSWVHDCKRCRIDLRTLITGVVISPWAEPDAVEEIALWIQFKGFPSYPLRPHRRPHTGFGRIQKVPSYRRSSSAGAAGTRRPRSV